MKVKLNGKVIMEGKKLTIKEFDTDNAWLSDPNSENIVPIKKSDGSLEIVWEKVDKVYVENKCPFCRWQLDAPINGVYKCQNCSTRFDKDTKLREYWARVNPKVLEKWDDYKDL